MLNGTVEPLLTMLNSSNHRSMSRMMNNGDSNETIKETPAKRTAMKASSLLDLVSPANHNSNTSNNNDNRIKFIDMLVCGSCQQDFQLSDIVKFIEHKAKCGNKENKQNIPYHFPQRHARRQREEGDHDNDEEEEEDDEDDDERSRPGHPSTDREFEQHTRQKQESPSKVLMDTSGNALNNSGTLTTLVNIIALIRLLAAEPYNFKCSQCGDIYSTGRMPLDVDDLLSSSGGSLAWFLIQHYQNTHGIKMYSACLNETSSTLPMTKQADPTGSTTNSVLSNNPSMLNIDLALFEAAMKEATASNRPLTSSTTSASKKLMAAANAARSVQQQQQNVSSGRTKTDTDSPAVDCHSTGAHAKSPASYRVPPVASSAYPSLLQEVARSNTILRLFEEIAKQQCCQTCGKDNASDDCPSTTDTPFLTPKSMDASASQVGLSRSIAR